EEKKIRPSARRKSQRGDKCPGPQVGPGPKTHSTSFQSRLSTRLPLYSPCTGAESERKLQGVPKLIRTRQAEDAAGWDSGAWRRYIASMNSRQWSSTMCRRIFCVAEISPASSVNSLGNSVNWRIFSC